MHDVVVLQTVACVHIMYTVFYIILFHKTIRIIDTMIIVRSNYFLETIYNTMMHVYIHNMQTLCICIPTMS